MGLRRVGQITSTEPLRDATDPVAVQRAFDQLRRRVLDLDVSSSTAAVASGGPLAARMVITSPIAMTGLPTADNVTAVAGDIVLLTAQANPVDNGPYIVPTWERVYVDDGDACSGLQIAIIEGQFWRTTTWSCQSPVGSVVGTNGQIWRVIDTQLPDIGFDSSDIFAVLYGKTMPSSLSTLSNQITADTWTVHRLTAADSLTPYFGLAKGPFGEICAVLARSMGILGPASSYPMPAEYTLTFWAYFELTNNVFSTSTMLNVGRTDTNTPTTGGWSGEYIWACSCPINTAAGSGQDPLRYINVLSRDGGGVATNYTADFTSERAAITNVGTWHHIAITRRLDGGTPYTFIRVDGAYRGDVVTTNPPNNTTTGRWVIGRPNTADAPGVINGNYFRVRAVRLSGVRSEEWTNEQAARGLAWV